MGAHLSSSSARSYPIDDAADSGTSGPRLWSLDHRSNEHNAMSSGNDIDKTKTRVASSKTDAFFKAAGVVVGAAALGAAFGTQYPSADISPMSGLVVGVLAGLSLAYLGSKQPK